MQITIPNCCHFFVSLNQPIISSIHMSLLWNAVDEMIANKDTKKLSNTPGSWRARRFSVATSNLPGISTRELFQQAAPPSFVVGARSNSLVAASTSVVPPSGRRLSHVGEVVSRRLSSGFTTGWLNLGLTSASSAAANGAAVEAKNLCAQYIRARFRRSAIFHRKLGLQRLRSVMNMTAVNYGGSSGSTEAGEQCAPGGHVFQCLNAAGKELELRHPKIFASVCRQVCRTLSSERAVQEVFMAVAGQLFPRHEPVKWCRLVALFAVAGGLAVDCVQQGHVDYVLGLIETFGVFVHERELAAWVAQQGGWSFLVDKLEPGGSRLQTCNWTMIFLIPLIAFSAFYIISTVWP